MADEKTPAPGAWSDIPSLDFDEPDMAPTVPHQVPPPVTGTGTTGAPTVPLPKRPAAPKPPQTASPTGATAASPLRPTSPLSQASPLAPAQPTGGNQAPFQVGEVSQVQDYKILRPLGRGGMAHVYLGERKDGKQSAIKLLLPQYAQDEEIVRRFMLEMKAGSALKHENVLEIHEFGEHRGQYFMASAYMDAGSLRDLVIRAGGKLPVPVVEAVTIMLLRGLGAAHARQLIHRDVKPANLLLSSDGTAKLADFGIARATEMPGITKTGLLMGTPAYMSPEQAKGTPVDHRSDLFTTGTVLYELLTGFNPFVGQNEAGSIMNVIQVEPPLLFEIDPTIPPHLEAICARLMQKDPALRYPHAGDALADFARTSNAIYANPADIVREALKDPAKVTREWAISRARDHYTRGVMLADQGPGRKPMAILQLVRAHLCAPGETQALQRLKEIYGDRDPFGPPHNPKILELEAEVAKAPSNHALLMQLASLHKLEMGLIRAIACYKRALRIRPDDGFAMGQLKTLIGDEADTAAALGHLTLRTVPPRPPGALLSQQELLQSAPQAPASSSSVVSGSPPAQAKPRTAPAPAPMAALYQPPAKDDSLKAKLPMIIGIAVALLAVFLVIRGISRFIKSATDSTEEATLALQKGMAPSQSGALGQEIDRKAQEVRERTDAQFREASKLYREGNLFAAEPALVQFRNENPKHPKVPEATFFLANIFVKDGRTMSAVEEAQRFMKEAPGDERVPQVRWMLAESEAKNGDVDGALAEATGIVTDHPSSPLVTRALFLQGELLEKKGDPATAKVRFEAVKSRTGPSDELFTKADEALTRLGSPAPLPQ